MAGPLLLVPLFIRHLEAAEYGIWITTLSITGYFGLLNLGIAQVVVGIVTRNHSLGTVGDAARFLATAFTIYLALALTAWLGASVALLAACDAPGSGRAVNCLALWITSSFFLAALPASLFLAALRGCKQVGEEQLFNAGAMLVRYTLTAAALVAGFKLAGIAIVHGLAGLIPGALAYFRLRRREPSLRVGVARFDRSLVAEIVKPSAWFVVLQVSGVLVWGVDTVVIAYFLGPAAVPSYAVPLQLILAAQAISSIMTNASAPHLAGLVVSGRGEEGKRLYLDLFSISMAVAAVGCVAVWFGGRQLLGAWAGPAVVPDVPTIVGMGVLLAIQCSLLPADSVLVGAMRHRGYAVVSVVEGLINLALSIWWINTLGVFGVILATLVARICTNWWFLLLKTSRILGLRHADHARIFFRSFGLPVIVGAAAAWSLRELAPSLPALVSAAVACLASCVVAITLQRAVIAALDGRR